MSNSSTGLSAEERRGAHSTATPQQIDRVRTIAEAAAILGIGVPSLRNMLWRGEGPKVTRLSARRIGIRDSDRTAWLDAQAVTQPA